ncbi:MAG: acyl-CoA/acyl-ACP dehydrogenase [Pseudomonadota bacterium]|nr:acyl-CoA/acyl-ACP dehydrogenase [Pseudomonadota bacterium]
MSFRLLAPARALLEQYAPGFDAILSEMPYGQREAAHSPVIGLFKKTRLGGLLAPTESGGLGATALQAIQVQYALGSRSPSLAVATTMHQFSMASLVAMVKLGGGAEVLLINAIATQGLLLASGFAEGVPGRGILDSGLTATAAPGGVHISGSKKPCSLAHSMDLLTASYVRPSPNGEELMIALIPAASPGLLRKPYWHNHALAGGESDEIVLENVFVSDKMIFSAGCKAQLEPVQVIGFIWFELLMSASYLGACAGLVEQVVVRQRWNDSDRVDLAAELQLAWFALHGAAHALASELARDDLLASVLLLRYGLEKLLARVSVAAHEMLGGNSFIASADSSNWLAACRGLCFHPPARISMYSALGPYLGAAQFSLS